MTKTLSWCGGDIYGVCSETASAIKHGNFSEQDLFEVVIDEAAQVGSQTLNTNCPLSNQASFIFNIYYMLNTNLLLGY